MADPGFVHSTALVESDRIGPGTRVWAFAHILDGAIIGSDCKIGDHVFIEGGATIGDRVTVKNNALIWHGVHIGDDVFVGPNVVFTNDLLPRAHIKTGPEQWLETWVESGASIGANATILCGVRLGAHSMVGAGSVVAKDVAPHELVVGNPASHRTWLCDCGRTLPDDLICPSCGNEFSLGPGGDVVKGHP